MGVRTVVKDAMGVDVASDPYGPVICVNTSGTRQVFDMGDPADARKVSHYEVEPGEEFTVPRCYAYARLVNDDGHEAVGSILAMLAPGCHAKDSAKGKAFEAQKAAHEAHLAPVAHAHAHHEAKKK